MTIIYDALIFWSGCLFGVIAWGLAERLAVMLMIMIQTAPKDTTKGHMRMLTRQFKIDHERRRLDEPCPFCRRSGSVVLWYFAGDDYRKFQVICGNCEARSPRCDCGEESAVPMWLNVQPTPPKDTP